MTLTLYKFTAGEASPIVVYGKGTLREAVRYALMLHREHGVIFSGRKVLDEDRYEIERNGNVRVLSVDLENDRRHEATRRLMNDLDAAGLLDGPKFRAF